MSRPRRFVPAAFLVASLVPLLAACDDQIKYIPIFSTMSQQPSIETYEEQPWLPPEGAVPVDAERAYDLLAADSLLTSPLPDALTEEELARGEERFAQFCLPCHGPTGRGDGSVVGPNRIPALPTLNLMSQRARDFSDGYVWGMIANGRGLMPAYKRIPADERWLVVAWLRDLQARSPVDAQPEPMPAAGAEGMEAKAARPAGEGEAGPASAAGGGR
jgi:mono/diheme cytochrome c family protein